MNPFLPPKNMSNTAKYRIWATQEQRIIYFYDCVNKISFCNNSASRKSKGLLRELIFEIK